MTNQQLARRRAIEVSAQLPCCVCGAAMTESGTIMAFPIEFKKPFPLTEDRYLGIAAPLCDDCDKVVKTPEELRARVSWGELVTESKAAWWASDESEFQAHLAASRN